VIEVMEIHCSDNDTLYMLVLKWPHKFAVSCEEYASSYGELPRWQEGMQCRLMAKY